jgi:DNA-binding CsgD family transcriptional regulator/tetratricopeptide (TPR) repeat protein
MPHSGRLTLLSQAFVGRDEEFASLQEAWRQGGSARVVSSAAGIGKSRLVRELGSWSLTAGGLVLTGRCSPTGQTVPLRPWREALLAAARAGRRPGAGLESFVPALSRVVPEWGDAAAEGSALVLGEAVLRLLSSWASPNANALLLIEDLQWADPESVAVLEYVVDNLAGAPLLVVATLRDGEPGPGADVAADLVARRAALDLRLGPLSDDEVLAVARSCLHGDELPREPGAVLVARCEGVPFLVEELLATAVRSGWDTITDDVPGSVAASVATRLHDLPPTARSLLIAAALLGRHFDWILAATTAGIAEEEAAELLRLAVQAQLVDVEGAGFRFRHALTRDAVLAAALPVEQVASAARALAALTATDPDLLGEHCSLAAQLADAAGQPERASALWLQAAERALDDGSLESADALAGRARDAGGDDTRLAVDWVLVRVYAQSGQTARASALGQELLAVSPDHHERADLHLVLGAADLVAGRWDDAEAHATATRVLASADPARLARANALAAQVAMGRAEPHVAVGLAHSALEGARVSGQPEVQCEALEVIGRAARGRDLPAAEAAFTQALDIATAAGLRIWQARAMQELGTIDMFHSLSSDRLEAARRMAVEAGALAMAALVDLQLSALYEELGDVAASLEAAGRCEEASRKWHLSTLPMSLAVQAFAHAQVGNRPAAEAAIEAALATGEDRPHIEARAAANVRAVLHIVAGDLPAAARASDEGMAALRANPGATHTFPGQWALLRTILDDGGEAARAEVAALPADTPVSRTMLLAADAVAAGRAGQRAEADAMFVEVDAALAGDYRRAFVLHLVAPVAHADHWGDPIRWLRESLAAFESTRHAALAARCRSLLKDVGAPVPRQGRGETATVAPALAALGITSREVDVLALVALGSTNREVGERLFISTRTVDKHVERLLQKTGTTRAGLADLARQAGLLTT